MNKLDIYRKMTGEQRLKLTLQMSEKLRKQTFIEVKKQYSYLTHKEQIFILRGRLDQMDL
ncbi:MAG: hypothetical protein UV61_C0005G0007 [Candidatus Gottesmanbacteria bacterium GW2011_GWB1_43_11]|uniref:Uncharacterized protein n=1 Tax=Candidatus Gottesmanbacteria bacterium GW2011_GWB1_43_11 TaxID=1618446 RepID=A0A0G1EVC8_9BACT|nr:MAG: hypothetical protein UV04_C0010G0007 [Candidatus Gottesmanbacteria bacterium GW2011_GWA2_42_16]KKS55898.1 MAG: hypothetical protein UV17_C0005G0007 [Candidatus Gottesmanbacteria bacterium GW2011_GWA1_42_26]KKS86986.1 MAG: hypothetical protein UV61_C0005G0007 [Candidatus Gottesmanbacteria bacterium GW2011_GWB1_43_11]OGG07822.1 MAG: hypothetical protein A2699_04615 [Candidatus Gottesmanbacteria bacterium RIFCSPHIGHO2_01_FULL_43_15]OGG25416.1 MAG: hypothetical protein A3A59_03265 [Candidat